MVIFKATVVVSALFGTLASAIWPVPWTYRHREQVMWIDYCAEWIFDAPKNLNEDIHARVERAIRRAKMQVVKRQLVPWKLRPHGIPFDPSTDGIDDNRIKKVVIMQQNSDEPRAPKYGELDESYEVYVPGTSGVEGLTGEMDSVVARYGNMSTIYVIAPTSAGILQGLTTLGQLFYAHSEGKGVYTDMAPVQIKDKPRFEHRGLNLDVARQWYPKDVILKVIDGMAWNKLNKFHLHMTDAQSWPLEVPALSELHAKGIYYKDLYYSPEDIQDIYQYAEDRGIQVIMEIDMPGHTAVIGEAYPDLIAGKNIQPLWTQVAAQPPSGHLKLNNKEVEDFVGKLVDDVVPRLVNYSKYFHTGGDEVNKNIYLLDEGVKSNDSTVIKPYLEKFLKTAHDLVRKNGATPVVWEEMVVEWNIDLPKDTIVQTWLGDSSVKDAISKGYKVIAGNYLFWYLDCGNGQWLDFHGMQGYPYNDWCGPKKNWRLMYTYDPISGLSVEEQKSVLGAEVHVWSEQIDEHSIDSTIWPRAGAAAEVLWSGRVDQWGKNRTFSEASPRLAEIRERMVNWGIDAAPLMQLWCHQHEGQCEFPQA